ncbi:MAG: beta-N-acetylglucosaminidase domain-containing protein, partial [Gelidibacter sp.]
MKRLLSGLFILTAFFGFAQKIAINPTPQQTVISNYIDTPTQFILQQKNVDKATQNLLATFFNDTNTSNKGFTVTIGDINGKFHKKFLKKVPQTPEGYFINSSNKNITVIGRDARGTYYGVRTLLALLASDKFPQGEIIDYPDVTARGVVEGFYGTPWSFEHRMRQIDFYGENKLNTYIYGPKDDPYHRSPNWRKPYPEEEAIQLKKLIDRAEMNHLDFVWAVHPGQDIKWNDEDRTALLHKFELMYDLGIRSYAVFFDDISGEGTNANQQAAVLNFLHNNFVKVKKDVKPLIMCPTEYNKGWSKVEGGYLKTLGNELDPSIRIMWTGNKVVSDIDKPTMEWINDQIQRKAFIWWNFPVSDYVRNHLLMGPTYGNGKDIANDISGFVSNPMEHAEASKIAIYGVADYSWNMAAYEPEKNWLNALQVVLPENYRALEIFASHNSDLGPNGHNYRREESVKFGPIADAFVKQLEAGENIDNFNA